MKTITLSQGYVALVSDKDYARVSQHKWHADVDKRKDGTVWNVYALRTLMLPSGKKSKESLHRFVLGVTDLGIQIDHHPDSSGLNCQRCNLRIATRAENQHNQRVSASSSSGLKGVTWSKATSKWEARIQVNGTRKTLGYFSAPREAAHAYDQAALRYFGRFSCTNQSLGLLPTFKKPVQSVGSIGMRQTKQRRYKT